MSYVEFRSAAVETLTVEVSEEDEAGKQDGASCNRDLAFREEDVFEKQDGAVRIRTRWTQYYQR